MRNWLDGFRLFLVEGQGQPVALENGMAEIQRLETTHYLLVVPLGHQQALRFVTRDEYFGHEGKGISGTQVLTYRGFQAVMQHAGEEVDLVLAFVPKRWFKKTQRKGTLLQQIEEFLPNGTLPNNYVWGIFTKWNDNTERMLEQGMFYRNPRYHANDSLKDAFDARPSAIVQQSVLPPSQKPNHAFHAFDSAPMP